MCKSPVCRWLTTDTQLDGYCATPASRVKTLLDDPDAERITKHVGTFLGAATIFVALREPVLQMKIMSVILQASDLSFRKLKDTLRTTRSVLTTFEAGATSALVEIAGMSTAEGIAHFQASRPHCTQLLGEAAATLLCDLLRVEPGAFPLLSTALLRTLRVRCTPPCTPLGTCAQSIRSRSTSCFRRDRALEGQEDGHGSLGCHGQRRVCRLRGGA